MKKRSIKINKILTSFGFFSLIVISNNTELNAKYKLNDFQIKNDVSTKKSNKYNYSFINFLNKPNKTQFISKDHLLIANENNDQKTNVLISEIIITGWEDHPEGRKLELAAYDSMSIKPGSVIDNEKLKKDLNSIYLSGLFSGVKFKTEEGPLGVRLVVNVIPNPIFQGIKVNPREVIIPQKYLNNIFNKYYGKTLNFNILKEKINEIKKWYEDRGYSLARISGPERISADGRVKLNISEGRVSKIELRFIGNDEEVRKGKTKDWVIKRELKTTPNSIFNRKILEEDIKRLYSISLFNDIKVSLSPDKSDSDKVIITLDISEQRTGSLTGGIGFSNSAGIFAEIGLQESNALGRAWSTSLNINFGEYSTTYNFSIFDPWIKGDKHKTSFKTNIFLSRDYPQEFRSESNGRFYGVKDFYQAPGTVVAHEISDRSYSTVSAAKAADSTRSWFDYEGRSIVLENIGGGFSFSRPLNGGDPFKKSPWRILGGMNFKKVSLQDSSGNSRPYAVAAVNPTTSNVHEIICLGYKNKDGTCPSDNTLISFLSTASRKKVDNPVNPTSGNILRLSTEQFVSFGDNSPTFNRLRGSYSLYIPKRFINLTKGCKDPNSDNNSCPQTIAFQLKSGTIIGELPPYESFCMGGSSSVRGWGNCDLGVSRTFAEVSAEYRFPIWRMISGSLFADAGSDLGTQEDVPGKPGKLLKKEGSGYSLGGGFGIKTPVGPIRIDAASQDLSGNMRYTIGVGWKF